MLNNQTFTAIIPVRAGSRRLKDKNIAPFGGSNLLLNKIEQLKNVAYIDTIVVSSDSDLMLDMAKEAGAQTHKRTFEYCDEMTKTFGEVVERICSDVEGDHIIWATCTSPLVTADLFTQAIEKYLKMLKSGKDSLLTVESFQKYVLSEKGPLNYQPGKKHVPSQELEKWFFKTNGIMISPRLKMIEWQYLYGVNPYYMEIDKIHCVDVDDELDLAQAESWLKLIKEGIYKPKF
jgi:CMP-N-acetylneuraminic acid synthetase